MSSHHQKISNEEQDMSSSAIDITGDMSEELPIQSTDTSNHRSRSDTGGSSSSPTFFEIVNPRSPLARSPRPKTKRAKSSIVVVIEDSFSTAFEFDCPDHTIDFDSHHALSPCSPPDRRRLLLHTKPRIPRTVSTIWTECYCPISLLIPPRNAL
ncbi:hypothetical protein H4Q26_001516 [Puccinia striiformis f. sp. tritici PST-130]|nr:hypothetical protein H4Q26_001516 [Puccinia striiformis f. sp. tritici PST-130]